MTLRHPKIVICGNYGATNLGDEALLAGMIKLLKETFSAPHITVMSASPQQTEELHQVKGVAVFPSGPRSFWRAFTSARLHVKETIRAVREADFFILGGGGLFTDEKPRAILIWSIQAFLALHYKKTLLCLGQSVGPLKTVLGRYLTRRVFQKAKGLSVRDRSSLRLLQSLGIRKVEALADMAFGLEPATVSRKERKPYIVLSLRPWLKKSQKDQLRTLARLIDWIYKEYGYESLLVPFQTFQDDDRTVLQEVLAQVQHKKAARLDAYNPDYLHTLQIISKAKAVLGMRLHSLIFATLTETPFLALSYSEKVSAFVKELELDPYLFDWSDLNYKDLQQKFQKLEKEHIAVSQKLAQKKLIFAEKVRQNQAILTELEKSRVLRVPGHRLITK
jgi:polysaccharide pyruvyl transferase CsaB